MKVCRVAHLKMPLIPLSLVSTRQIHFNLFLHRLSVILHPGESLELRGSYSTPGPGWWDSTGNSQQTHVGQMAFATKVSDGGEIHVIQTDLH